MNDIPKRRLLKAAQTQLNMAQEDYVAMLIRITGKHSSTLLSKTEINDVLDEFKRLGFKSTNPRDAAIKYITYLWMRLGENEVLHNPTRAAMLVYCNKVTKNGVYKASTKQLSTVIESLKSWCDRENITYKGKDA